MIWVRREDLVSTADDASATPSAPLSAAGSSCTAVSMFSTVSFPSPLRQQLRQFRRQLGQLTGTLQHVGLELRDRLGRDSPTAQPHHVHAGYPGRNASTDGEGWQFTGDSRPHANHCAGDRKSTRLNSSHVKISYAVFCL